MLMQTAPAKVNLYLHVTGKRQDGYHLLDSLVVFADICDYISITPSDNFSLDISGPYARQTPTKDNIIERAIRRLAELARKRPDFAVKLKKNIPVAAGLGGGSANAAAALKALCKIWHLDEDDLRIYRLALELGADVPICYYGKTRRMQGIGEQHFKTPPIPQLPAVLINPNKPVSTGAVFKALNKKYDRPADPPKEWADYDDFIGWLNNCHNSLSPPAEKIEPEIKHVLDAFGRTNANLHRMSGSGASCFGLYRTIKAAEQAAKTIQDKHPDWWVRSTILNSKSHLSHPSPTGFLDN